MSKPIAPYPQLASAPRGEWPPTPPAPARIEWREGQPYSTQFDDIYYSRAGGLAEAREVFLAGAGLPDAWSGARSWTIGELGFGTGLLFLAARQVWRNTRPEAAVLHYLSYEKHPLLPDDFAAVQSNWPELADDSLQLQRQYPLPTAGAHRLEFPDDGVYLTLFLGEAAEYLPLTEAAVDTWFLDGFAPAKNPELWTEEICRELARLSRPGTRLATYTAARQVRDSLAAAGFTVEKQPGFGGKREKLSAELSGGQARVQQAPCRVSRAGTVAIIGGGLAGCSLAYSFAKRGKSAVIIERDDGLAQRASGNQAAVLMAYLSVKPDFLSRFYLSGYLYTLRMLAELELQSGRALLARCGVLRLASSSRLQSVYENLPAQQLPAQLVRRVAEGETAAVSGVSWSSRGMFFSEGGWLDPRALCKQLAAACGGRIRTVLGSAVERLERDGEGWLLSDQNGKLLASADLVVAACGYHAAELPELGWLPVEKVRGQVQRMPKHPALAGLGTVVCYDGYIMPEHEGGHFIGATYDHHNHSTEIELQQQQRLIERLQQWSPDAASAELKTGPGRVGFRTMSPDRLPLLGPAARAEHFEEEYKAANNGQFGLCYPRSADIPGLYLSIGHGSRGLLSAPLGAELIASQALGEPPPLETDLIRAVDPCRFLVRAVKRGTSHFA